MSSRYTSLRQYIEERLDAIGETMTHLSETLGWSPSYIASIARGQYKGNPDRLRTLARAFGDDPAIIMELSGYYVPDTGVSDREEALLVDFRSLSPSHQRELLRYVGYLKHLEDEEREIPDE